MPISALGKNERKTDLDGSREYMACNIAWYLQHRLTITSCAPPALSWLLTALMGAWRGETTRTAYQMDD